MAHASWRESFYTSSEICARKHDRWKYSLNYRRGDSLQAGWVIGNRAKDINFFQSEVNEKQFEEYTNRLPVIQYCYAVSSYS